MQTAFFVRIEGKFKRIPFDSVLYINSKKNYVEIVTASKKKFIVYGSITYLEKRLPENIFCRVHRSYIVSIGKINCFDHNHVEVGDELLPINKEGFEKIMERIIFIHPELENKLQEKARA